MLRNLVPVVVLMAAAGVHAQAVDESALDALESKSVASVQPSREPTGAAELRAAMRRISFNATDADALADAGNAALALGDANAALNFFTRANGIRPNNGRIVAGLATATVRTENPFEALRLFDEAVRLGISDRSIAADRGLAFDLLGNFARAQQDYKLARTAAASDDLVIREAISLSLAGQKAEADALLVPLLNRNNVTAWRARAFMLAARGDYSESNKVTRGFMDASSAQRMERFLRLMPDLTAAQQAAAIHLGHFPASQYVGRDSDQLRRVASTIAPVVPSGGETRLIPTGAPLGPKTAKALPASNDKRRESKRERQAREKAELHIAVAKIPEAIKLPKSDPSRLGTEAARAKIAEAETAKITAVAANALPPPDAARALVPAALPRAIQAQPLPQPSVTQPTPAATTITVQSAPALTASPPVSSPATTATRINVPAPTVAAAGTSAPGTAISSGGLTTTPPGPALSGAPLQASSSPAIAAPAITPLPAPAAATSSTSFDLAAVVSAIEIPESEQKPSAVPVDLKKIKPVTPKTAAVTETAKVIKADPKTAAKGKAAVTEPARYWVQIATGDADALGFDYRRLARKSADLFKGQNGWTSVWGRTDRLLVGPFADMKAAKKWETDYKKAGGDGFMWKSENGVAVTALKSK